MNLRLPLWMVFSLCIVQSACNESGTSVASQINLEDATTEECLEVGISDLYDNPQNFAGHLICTAGVLNVEYHGSGIYPDSMIGSELLLRFLLIDTPLVELVVDEYRSRDLVFAKGRFDFARNCFEPHRGLEDEEEWKCLPIDEPMYLTIEELALDHRPDPFEICREVTIGELDSRPEVLAWQMICARGYLHAQDDEWFLLSELAPSPENLMDGLNLGTLYMTGDENRLSSGAHVYVVGNALGRNLELFDLRPLGDN